MEEPSPLEKVHTPDCKTIAALAKFLGVPESQTAKAVFLREVFGNRLVVVIVRGDMEVSLRKLKRHVMTEPADEEDIRAAGAEPGYGSPIGLHRRKALVIVDELVAVAPNLAAGANEAGYHFKNANYGRDYNAHIVADIAQANAGDPCFHCGTSLEAISAALLANMHFRTESRDAPTFTDAGGNLAPVHVGFFRMDLGRIFAALAELYHDEHGLTLPAAVAPFDVHLIMLPGKQADTRTASDKLYKSLQRGGLTVLYDDRDERAGVKFNDADLIGCSVRVTVGERNLDRGLVEVKARKSHESELVPQEKVAARIKDLINSAGHSH